MHSEKYQNVKMIFSGNDINMYVHASIDLWGIKKI